MSYGEIWKKLSAIDVSEHIEKKGSLNYLSWAWAYGVMMEHYPEMTYTFDRKIYDDGTAEVICYITIGECMRMMWLPVLDYRNKPIQNPSSFDYNTAKMRALTKCISMFGLGHYIYAGQDLPQAVKMELEEPINSEQRDNLLTRIEDTGSDMDKFLKAFNVDELSQITVAQYKKAMQLLERKNANS